MMFPKVYLNRKRIEKSVIIHNFLDYLITFNYIKHNKLIQSESVIRAHKITMNHESLMRELVREEFNPKHKNTFKFPMLRTVRAMKTHMMDENKKIVNILYNDMCKDENI